jgi:hypothetical protein
MLERGKKVKIIKLNSAWYGKIGEIFSGGNGNMWQVTMGLGIGIYFSENELEEIIC